MSGDPPRILPQVSVTVPGHTHDTAHLARSARRKGGRWVSARFCRDQAEGALSLPVDEGESSRLSALSLLPLQTLPLLDHPCDLPHFCVFHSHDLV